MGLYLAVFDGDEELDGVEVGSYDDFGWFRDTIAARLEGGVAGSRFPTLIMHSDCDGRWSVPEAFVLEKELTVIAAELKRLPPVGYNSDWQHEAASTFGIVPSSLCECFFDVDGEPLIERLILLAQLAQRRGLPILFQ